MKSRVVSAVVVVTRLNPTEIIRCLLRDGHTMEGGARYCRRIAIEARWGAYTNRQDADAYDEAARRLEQRAKEEKLAVDHVNGLEETCERLARHIVELQHTVLEQQAEIERLKMKMKPQKTEEVICQTCKVRPVDEHGWCSKCGNYTCLKCKVSMRRRDLQRRSAGFQCPECNDQKFD